MKNKGLPGALQRASRILLATQPKVTNPLSFEPGQLHFVIAPKASFQRAERLVTQRFVVRALRPITLTITSDLLAVTVAMGDEWKPVPDSNWLEKEVKVQVEPSALPEKTSTVQTTLNASSEQVPDFKGQLPVFIELR